MEKGYYVGCLEESSISFPPRLTEKKNRDEGYYIALLQFFPLS